MKTAMQLKALIRNLARGKSLPAEVVLRIYMLERFLERLSLSKFKHRLILKGGLLIADMIGIEARSTMDLDATIKGVNLTEEALTSMLNEILVVPLDDGVQMTIKHIETIRDEADYPGTRITIEAMIEKIRQIIKIDITTGDVITPKEVQYDYKLLIEERVISILAYNTETVLAEKLETILSRNTASTRMRDYYDAHMLIAGLCLPVLINALPKKEEVIVCCMKKDMKTSNQLNSQKHLQVYGKNTNRNTLTLQVSTGQKC